MFVSLFYICIVFVVVTMYFSGLRSVINIWMCGIIKACGMNLESLGCVGIRCIFIISL